MQNYFKEIEESGEIEHPLHFRDGDFLQELPEAINRGLKSLQGLKVQADSIDEPKSV